MEQLPLPQKNRNDRKLIVWIILIASFPMYWASLLYIKVVVNDEVKQLAFAATVGFFGAFYMGWLTGKAWAARSNIDYIPTLKKLGIVILMVIFWMFLHADFQFRWIPALNLLLFWLPYILLGVLCGIEVILARLYFVQQVNESTLTAAHSKSELQLLQSQLSPHFLFNTLNNLYGLSITQHEKVPPLLLKLSELLRYSVYDAKELFVPLKSEVEYINNYIQFEKIRMGERLQLTTEIETLKSEALKIAPMLLIVFIENAFKHSKNTTDKHILVNIALKTWGSTVLFSVKNSYAKESSKTISNKNDSGVGMANAMKRLELLYPEKYHLKVEDKDGIYNVMLQLNVSE
ncbi:MAG TPA: histidine kinase [Flavitalea sp.]|nr:histidine kinase [Flavitalea sp.]